MTTLSQAKDANPLKVQSIGSESLADSNEPTSPLLQETEDDICRPCTIDSLKVKLNTSSKLSKLVQELPDKKPVG